MRRWLLLPLALTLVVAVTGSPLAAGNGEASKLSPALRQLVDNGGYGNFPIKLFVPGYKAGDVYYMAKVTGTGPGVVNDLQAAGATVRFRYPSIGWAALVSPVSRVAAVSTLSSVRLLDLDHFSTILAATATPGVADQAKRGTRDVGADTLWAQGITGENVTVGIADSGIDSTHPDLDDQDWRNWDAPLSPAKIATFVDCTAVLPTAGGQCRPTQGYDDNGHGTHVSGIATGTAEGGLPGQHGKLPGMAPEATLAGAKVCLAAGSCLNSSVMAGLQYLAAEKAAGGAGAEVINVSLGSGRSYWAGVSGAEQSTNNDPEVQLVNTLAEQDNVLFTISAGNSGPVLQSIGSPGLASQALGVGAAIADWDLNHPTSETEHGVYGNIRPQAAQAGATAIAAFSSRGPTGDRLIKPDVTAPGSFYVAPEAAAGGEIKAGDAAAQNNYSADPFYAVLSGTSMSSPAAAGAAALVIDGFKRYTGTAPAYYRVKSALANTAGTRAWEGSITGLTSSIRVKLTGEDPNTLRPVRNADWVGVTGEGAGRVYAPAALLALTQGVVVHTQQVGALDDVHELQPSWSLDTVARGHTATQAFVAHGGPGLPKGSKMTFAVESQQEADGVQSAPAAWFTLPKAVKPVANGDVLFTPRLTVPAAAAPGMYSATIVGKVKVGQATENVRVPVQFYVDLVDADPAEGAGISVESSIWASDTTDYSTVGALDPSGLVGDIFTDWITYPVRLTEGTQRVDFSVYDPDGKDHMDVFVFDDNGQEIDSTVSFFLDHTVPGGLSAPTTQDDPASISILDGDDLTPVTLPATVWVVVSDSVPSEPPEWSTFHLDVDVVGGNAGGGTTPPERIHSGTHAWWSGSVNAASSTLTESVDLSGAASAAKPTLHFWTWYQMEEGFDWAYALVSTDGGASWTSLPTTAASGSGTTTLDPLGQLGEGSKSYPNGLTGTSGKPAFAGGNANGLNVSEALYTEQTADLSAYAGRSILLRFAYTSDGGVNYEGFYVDDVSIANGAGTPLGVGVVNPDDAETQGAWSPGGTPGFSWVTADAAG